MVFFLERIISSSKQENHHHHLPSKKMCLALNTFESEISKSLCQLNSNSEILTLSWIQQCLYLLPKINKSFAKLVSDIDYPMSNWETPSIDEYLSYSLSSMEYLNSITSTISQLTQARIIVSHGLSLIETSQQPLAFKRLKVIEFENSNKKERQGEIMRSSTCSGKEWIIHQALLVKQQVWNWVCRVVESSIQGNLISEVNGSSGSSSLVSSNLRACKEIIMERTGVLMEVAQINDGVVRILTAAGTGDEIKELRRRLEVLGKLLESVEEDVSNLFSEILLNRNELLDIFQQKKYL